MWTYKQDKGLMQTPEGMTLDVGYSGNGAWMNEPHSQSVADHGPIPQGRYTIGVASTHPKLGPVAMELAPDPANEMFGRSGFFIHGDNVDMDHTASDGCIILDRWAREAIAESRDRELIVTA